MEFIKKHGKRVGIDAVGYLLLIASALTGWLPGPGGLPLLIAGLGLLSINNKWARDLREYTLTHGSNLIQKLFPKHPVAQWAYDLVVIVLYALAATLAWMHAAYWQIMLATSLFFFATFVALMNRDRLERLKNRRSRRKNSK